MLKGLFIERDEALVAGIPCLTAEKNLAISL